MLTRRSFLKSSPLLALAPTIPMFLARAARAAGPKADARALVVVQLDGGNDALNTVVPFTDPEYAKLRPRLKQDPKRLVKLSDSLGLHPAMTPLGKLWEGGHLAVVPGVGYPNPNRSHFRSMAIWHTARFEAEECDEGRGSVENPTEVSRETHGDAHQTSGDDRVSAGRRCCETGSPGC